MIPHLKSNHAMAHRQKGVVLAITLILVVVLSLLGTFAIRNATQSERSIKGLQASNSAKEAAEAAIRFCDQVAIYYVQGQNYPTSIASVPTQAQINSAPITSPDDAKGAWRTAANWTSTNPNLISVPASFYKNTTATGAQNLTNPPLCIIERINSGGATPLTGYLVTARGFANNANFDNTTGKVSYGAEVWLQSTFIQ